MYGFLSSEKRNTLSYVHYHKAKPKKHGKQGDKEFKGKYDNPKTYRDGLEEDEKINFWEKEAGLMHLPPYLQKQMLFSNRTPIPYDIKHEYCERHFVYFVSRIAIVYNPLTNEQRFYEGHRYRITAISVHPSSKLFSFKKSITFTEMDEYLIN